jgi:hypothetical protein
MYTIVFFMPSIQPFFQAFGTSVMSIASKMVGRSELSRGNQPIRRIEASMGIKINVRRDSGNDVSSARAVYYNYYYNYR